MKRVQFVLATAILLFAGFCSAVSAQNYTIQQYLNIKSANSPSMSPDGREMAYLTSVTGTMQIWTMLLPHGTPHQLTNYDDNIGFVRWLGDGSGIIFGKARGGDENTQFYWMKPDGTGVKALTNEPAVRHNFGVISRTSDRLYYASNKRNRNYFDIYSLHLDSGQETLLYQQDGNNNIAEVNDSGTKLIISRDGGEFSLDNNLYLVNAETKAEILLTPHKGAAEFRNPHFTADGIVFTHNDNREFIALAELRKKNAAQNDWSQANLESSIIDAPNWDITDLEMNMYGSHMAYTVNREGFSEMYIRKYETDGKPLITVIDKKADAVKLPAQGVVGGLDIDKAQTKLAFSFSSANRPSDIWIYDLETKKLVQATHSDRAGIPQESFVEPTLIKFKTFDGLDIPAWYYKPVNSVEFVEGVKVNGVRQSIRHNRSLPVIVSIHGGPEGQERPGFNPLYQYYLSHGYAILAPNVRGSTGYGKEFTHLDDVRKREDTLKDLAHATKWLRVSGGADPKRIAVMGGSYGGYMTLAAITLNPDLWAAAVDTVGIANWESFLKNTSGYRRRQREVEYGSLEKDGDFLRSISPIAKVDRIVTPLFVIAGRNDPRVPYTEAEQIVGALRKRGATVEYKLFDDEGHGVSKLKNRLVLYPLVVNFLDKYMK